jgi:hypothetical protein
MMDPIRKPGHLKNMIQNRCTGQFTYVIPVPGTGTKLKMTSNAFKVTNLFKLDTLFGRGLDQVLDPNSVNYGTGFPNHYCKYSARN